MRSTDAQGHPGALPKEDIAELLTEHIPYRLVHLRDAVPRVPARCMADNQWFEAGAVNGRSLFSFLGIGYDRKTGTLREDRCYYPAAKGMTDDVKAPTLVAPLSILAHCQSMRRRYLRDSSMASTSPPHTLPGSRSMDSTFQRTARPLV
jgi:hypothetical protein